MEKYKAVALVGDAVYNGYWFPKEEIEKAYKTMIGKTFVIDHSYDINGVVGFIEDSLYEEPAMINIFTIDETLEASAIALKWIAKKEEREEMPEVSVAFSASVADEWHDDETPTIIDMKFIHLALVTAGACSPEDGCGILEGEWYEPLEYIDDGDYRITMGKYRMSEPDDAGRIVMEIRFGMRLEKVKGETMSEKDTAIIKLGDCVSIVTQLEAVNGELMEKLAEQILENKTMLDANETLRKRFEEASEALETLQMVTFIELAEDDEKITAPVEVEAPVIKLSDNDQYDRVTELLSAGGRKRVKTLRDEDD